MKKIIAQRFYLTNTQSGVVLLFTLFLLLIIATLTITFFYLQFLEVDLIANETEYLQAFYLAEAGLQDGIKELLENIDSFDPDQGEFISFPTQTPLARNKNGYSRYKRTTEDTDNPNRKIITITGIGWVGETTKNRREIERKFRWSGMGYQSPEDWPGEIFGHLVNELGYPVVVSKLEPNLEEPIIFIKKGHGKYEKISEGQSLIKTFNEMDTKERDAYNDFVYKSKTEIAKAQLINKNDNELLFPEKYRNKYNSPYLYLDGITSTNFSQFCKDCPFVYTEQRTKDGKISSSSMKLKSNKEFTLGEGLYFFVQLTLEKGSVLKTDGDVQIYVKKLELEEDARLMGGPSSNPDEAKPNDLVILAQRWEGAYYDPEDGVKIRPKAKIFGHIFAPDLKVRLSRGSGGKETRVHGSIITNQLVTYIEPGKQTSYGPIQIIYEEYLDSNIVEEPGSWKEVRNP